MLLITTLEATESTNSYLHNLIQSKKNINENSIQIDIPEFYTVCANFQSDGRGQKQNKWISDMGKNILISTLMYPELTAENQFYLNMSVTISILNFCQKNISKKGFSIKWPNDIYYGNSKIGGVLIEHTIVGNSILYTIVGIGLNINQASFPDFIPNPISAYQILGHTLDVDQCTRLLLSDLTNQRIDKSICFECIKKEYLKNLFRINETHKYIYNNNEISASIEDVNQYGMLSLTTTDGDKIECGFKEISYII